MRLRRLAGLTTLAALTLTGCSLSGSVPPPTAMPAVSSPASASSTAAASVTPSTAAATPEASPSSPASASTTAPSQPSQESSAEVNPAPTEEAPTYSQDIAAPGTKCGTISGESIPMVTYVFGGDVSCATALEVTQEYRAQVRAGIDPSYNRDMTVENIQGYTCSSGRGMMGAVNTIGGQIGVCTNSVTAGYLEIREDGERILPGFTASPYSHLFQGGSGIDVAFQTPSGTVQCQGTFSSSGDTSPITCTVRSIGGEYNQASLSQTGAATGSLTSSSAPVKHEAPLDVGTSLNFMGMSCQAPSEDTMHCVNAEHGFILSPTGVTTE